MSFRLFPNSPNAHDLLGQSTAHRIRYQWRVGGPVICQAIMVICVIVWLVEILTKLLFPSLFAIILSYGMFTPAWAHAAPWTFITSMFMHEPGLFHILFNMLTLWAVGPVLERMLGHWRFLGMYLLSGIGGNAAVLLYARIVGGGGLGGNGWMTSVYGASGALFGLFAALLIVYRRIGADITSMLIWMAINFAMPFLYPGIAWQAHVGGFIIGGAYAALLTSSIPITRGKSLTFRSLFYGIPLLIVIAAVSVWAMIPVLTM
ncbi:rhomboid family intramembrane serine protease [Bifidobacterium simiarum]|uniref:Rhomboid family intramembrane serine protease n=1 Tax=Bifidobacterium simiarum TaxID=2045441 RepID=A0A2M9HC97_9BIFI|nr:rhomboid family intramembrane serine protease [Bifidobacterium simiarum]PJM74448.1 rhomboid family intramembrane serine protease [Bifidobacterium simiarum]